MAPLLPKRRRVERAHEIQERAPKQGRRASKHSDGVSDAFREPARATSRRQTAPESDEDSSDNDAEEPQSSKQIWGSLLGALNVHVQVSEGSPSASTGQTSANAHSESLKDRDGAQRAKLELSGIGRDSDAEVEGQDEGHLNGEPEIDQDSEDDETSDPFEVHFANPDDNELSRRLASIQQSNWVSSKDETKLGRRIKLLPGEAQGKDLGQSASGNALPVLKQKLQDRGRKEMAKYKPLTSVVSDTLYGYRDLLYSGRTVANGEGLRCLTCLHAINHVLKTRDRVIKNTQRLAKDTEAALELRDQGFTRPKVLILLETRQMCVKYMEMITKLFDPEQQENKKRFEDAFVSTAEKHSEDKPLDFRELFEGNDDNEFRLGVKFTRKTIKYYSQFYASDIILASPLGLRQALKTDDPKHTDTDFLSSVELLIVDQAHAMLMQNFEHVEHIFDHLNLQPKEAHGCDFSRVRQWYLDGHSRHLRQTIVFSAYLTPELNGIFSKRMQNIAGKVKITPTYPGAITDIAIPGIRQTFTRYASRTPTSDPDDRFKYFVSSIIPLLNRHMPSSKEGPHPGLGALIFIPSYLDFVRVRNHFSTSPDTANLSFGSISEYTEKPAAARARSHFLAGRQSVMLYTGRAHHFNRYRIRGVKRVVLYGVPENPMFYQEIVGGFLGMSLEEGRVDAAEAVVRTLFSRFDGLALERVVGSGRVGRMLREGGEDVFEFS